jgi:5'-nucleotidase
MSNELEEAAGVAALVPDLSDQLSQARLELEAQQAALEALEQAQTVDPILPPVPPGDYSAANGYNGYAANGNGAAQTPTDPPAPEPPVQDIAPPPPAPRIHVVVAGDTLTRLANRYYGSNSQANIQRIMDANNITDPNAIRLGQELIIP